MVYFHGSHERKVNWKMDKISIVLGAIGLIIGAVFLIRKSMKF